MTVIYRVFFFLLFSISPIFAFAQATFDLTSGVLLVPQVTINNLPYTNLKAHLDSDGRMTILGITPPATTSSNGTCSSAQKTLSPSSFTPRAVYQSLNDMINDLAGTWKGCDIYGNPVSITFNGTLITGTVSKTKNYYATYTNCTYTAGSWMRLIDSGEWDFTVRTLNCAEGNGLDQVHGDIISVYVQGSSGKATALMLELDFLDFAVVTRQ